MIELSKCCPVLSLNKLVITSMTAFFGVIFYHLILSVFFHLRNHSPRLSTPPPTPTLSTPYHQHRQVFYQFLFLLLAYPNIPLVVTIASNYPSTDHFQGHLVTVYRLVSGTSLVVAESAYWRWNYAHTGIGWYDDGTLFDRWIRLHNSICRIALLNCWNRLSDALEDFLYRLGVDCTRYNAMIPDWSGSLIEVGECRQVSLRLWPCGSCSGASRYLSSIHWRLLGRGSSCVRLVYL